MTPVEVTRRGGQKLSVNPEFISTIESQPEPKGGSKITLYSGVTFYIEEERQTILDLIGGGKKK